MTEAEWMEALDPMPMLEYLRGPVTQQMRVHFGRQIPFEGYLHQRTSDRKARLFACACCRRIAHLFTPERLERSLEFMAPMREYTQFGQFETDCCVRTVELAERVADGERDAKQLAALREVVHEVDYPSHTHAATVPSSEDMDWDLMVTGSAALAVERAADDDFYGMSWVTRHAAEAVGNMKSQVTRDDPERDPAELAAQCQLLRDVVGNPFRPAAYSPSWRTDTVLTLARQMYEARDFSTTPILADALQDAGCDNEDILDHCRGPGPHVRGCWVVDLVLGKE